jgi:peptidoglycan L-alanyl-D-glutamate endopeptidase CwlK
MELTDIKIVELFARVDQTKLEPYFLGKCKQLVRNCAKRGYIYYATSGIRTWKESQDLYNKGRNEKGEVVDLKLIVTRALPGQSYHNYGIALDFCLDKDLDKVGLQPDWDIKSYKVLGEEAVKLGLEAGVFWKGFVDAPHIQLPLNMLGVSSIDTLRSLYLKRGEAGIKELLASKLPLPSAQSIPSVSSK